MQINHCLILAAGFGTRMGSIGQVLPKVLWPVFEKSLLELQVAYAKSLGIDNIFINLHFMGQQIEAYCKDNEAFKGVQFIWEQPEILDIGGAIHNIASLPSVNHKGRLLVLNADQFFYLKKDDLLRYLQPYKDYPAVLFSYWVNSSLGYNALKIDLHRMVREIVKNKEIQPDKKIETFTGISLIDLAKLKPVEGPSSFFESVCPFQNMEVPAILLEKVDYWDFGTVRRYWETSFKILSTYKDHSTHPFLRFLVNEKALKTWKIDLKKDSYHASSPHVINLGVQKIENELSPAIILKESNVQKRECPMIWYKEISEEVKP